jgi:5-methyltetrahydrofolate--homocysteine methyltransferase
MPHELKDAIVGLRMDEALTLARGMVADGTDPLAIIAEGSEAMQVIGRRYAEGEAFIPELIMGGEIMKSLSAEVLPDGGRPSAGSSKGTVVVGTVRGDIHDIGKDIVVLMLGIGGYNVHDLGTDVPVEGFVAAVREHDADIVGLSGLLTLAFDAMKSTVEGIAAAGLRDKVRIMIGGAAVDENVRAYAGADGWGNDVGHAVKLADEWTEGAPDAER